MPGRRPDRSRPAPASPIDPCPSSGSPPIFGGEVLRFSDVIDELEAIGGLVARTTDPISIEVAAAARRARTLLVRLRAQFLSDVVDGRPCVVGSSRA